MNLKDITVDPLKSVAELIDLYESLEVDVNGSGPALVPMKFRPSSGFWAFRGQARDFGTLVPSFQRQFSRQSYGAGEVIERRLIEAFRQHYQRLGGGNEMPTADRIGQNFDLRCLSVMQHYEIPTRLLDWTSNYWTAIYFACASDPESPAELWYYRRSIFEEQRRVNSALQSLLDKSLHPTVEPQLLLQRGQDLIVELDPQITPRMKQQFAHHTVSTDVFADHAPLLFELQNGTPSENGDRPLLQRVIIDSACKGKALQFLADELDITASTIFPDVVGLGRFLRWQFESLRTMIL